LSEIFRVMDSLDSLITEVAEVEKLLEKKKRRRSRSMGRFTRPKNISNLLATRIKDPLEWRTDITNAMAKTGGRVPDAADDLGVSTRTLYRNLEEPELDSVGRAPTGRPEIKKKKD
jgi:DNA-binding NtrC family response regulator